MENANNETLNKSGSGDEDDRVRLMDPMGSAAYQLISDYATDMISIHSESGMYVFVSPACKGLVGFSQGELVGVDPYTLFHPDDVDRIQRHHTSNVKSSDSPPITYRIKCKNGFYKWVETTSRTHTATGGVQRIIAITRDVTERERLVTDLEAANAKLLEIVSKDELTGVANRRMFNERMAQLIEESQRGRPFSIIVCDIDLFKRVNDAHGHQAGDRIIASVARLMVDQCRKIDMVSRYGGEEFALLLPGTCASGALILAGRIRAAVEAMQTPYGPITISIGVCEAYGDTGQTLFAKADSALYTAKEHGRNRVELFDNSKK